MNPVLYDKEKVVFENDYIGVLTDTISCEVTEERNGAYELEMEYPVEGAHYESIALDAILKAKPNAQDNPQPFRIYKISKALKGVITIYARHIVYDLSKVTVEPFTTTGGIQDAIAGIMNHSIPSCGFIFETDKTTTGNYKVSVPSSFRSLMGGSQGSLLDIYGTAEYQYDEFNINLLQSRGQDRGAKVEYGKNLIDMEQEEACDEVYTAVYPFWMYGGEYVSLDERIVSVEGTFPFSRIMSLDLSQDFQNRPTQAQLRTKAQQYITENSIGVPKVSLEVDFTMEDIEQINLCDIVSVDFEKLGVTASAKCISLTYDVLTERTKSVKLGYYKHTFIDTVVDQMKGITEYTTIEPTQIEEAIRDITDNGLGYVLLHSSTNTARIDEILIISGTNSPDNINIAQKIWRWNKNGIGYSSTGYNGTYDNAITMDGRIVATMIKTGVLRAIELKTSNDTFHVTSDGYLTSTAGYIGSQSGTGFEITANDISSPQIKLYEYGFALKNASGNVMAFIGKTDRAQFGATPVSFNPYVNPSPYAVNPGFGMFANSYTERIALAYKKNGNNYAAMYYPATFNVPYTNNAHIDDCLGITKNINMNGHGFYTAWRFVEEYFDFYNGRDGDPNHEIMGTWWTQYTTRVTAILPTTSFPALSIINSDMDFNHWGFAHAKGADMERTIYSGIIKFRT